MHPIPDSESLKQVDAHFLRNIKVGDRLFHYPFDENAEKSFEKSPSAEFTLFSVIGLPTDGDILLIGAFDETEKPQPYTRKSMLTGSWWYNPLF